MPDTDCPLCGGIVRGASIDLAAIETEAVTAALDALAAKTGPVVSHLAFECKNARVRQGVQMGAAAVLALIAEARR